MKRNLLSFLWLFAFFCSVGCDSNTDPSFESVDTVSIGVILPQTVPGPLQHEAEYAAIQLAIERVNEYLSENAPEKRVLAQIRDSRYSTEDILEALEDFVEMGIKVAVFSGLSSNLDNVKEFVHENGILIINQSSTATLLSEADNIFRLVPDDDYLSEVLAGVFTSEGYEDLILLNRGDIWGFGLAEGIEESFRAAGGNTAGVVGYDPRHTEAELAEALDAVEELVAASLVTRAPDEVALSFLAFDEGVDLLELAAGYPNLARIRWYGSDGFAQNQALLGNASALDFAAAVGVYCPIISEPATAEYLELKGAIEDVAGYSPYSLAVLLYDAFFLAALTRTNDDYADDIETMKTVLLTVLTDYDAVSGTIQLNANGDRTNFPYDFWGISPGEGWKKMFTAPGQ